MKIQPILIFASIVSIGFISCKKDSNSSSQGFEGTWNFTGLHSENVAINTYTDETGESKTITNSTYNTIKNSGTINFSGGKAVSTGVGYSVDTTIYAYDYQDNVLVDSFSSPFAITIPASGSISGYALVGKDSITFTGSSVVGTSSTGSPSGGHYTVADNKMTLTTSIVKDSSYTDGSALVRIHETADVKVYLEK